MPAYYSTGWPELFLKSVSYTCVQMRIIVRPLNLERINMKKIILIGCALFSFLILSAESVTAQTGIGVRGLLGFGKDQYGGAEVSLQKLNKWEMDLGWNSNDIWKFTYLRHQRLITLGEKLGAIYAGVGGNIGYSSAAENTIGGVNVDIGAFVLIRKIQVGVDWRPEIALWGNQDDEKDITYNFALALRYVLGGN